MAKKNTPKRAQISAPSKAKLKMGQEFAKNTDESRKSGLTKKIIRDENARANITQFGVSLRVDQAMRQTGKFYKTKKKK